MLINQIFMDPLNLTPPQTPISYQYRSKLFNKASALIEYSHQKQKQFQEFIMAFQKRIDAEIAYAKNLEQVSKYLDRFIEPETTKGSSFVCSAFKVDNEQRSNQARYLADSIRSQIHKMATEMLIQHTNSSKKLEKNVKKLNKELWYFQQSFQRAQTNYRSIDKESQQNMITKNIVQFTSTVPQEKKIKIIAKNNQLSKKKREYQKLYVQSLQQYNQFIRLYKKEVEEALNTLQAQQQARVTLSSDCMRKLIVCEISMFKNIEYDVINISKQMETVNPKNDIDYVVKEVLQIKEEKQVKALLVEKPLEIDMSMLSSSLRKIDQEYFSWMVEIKRNKRVRMIIEQRWKSLRESIPQNSTQIEAMWEKLQQEEKILTERKPITKNTQKPQKQQKQEKQQVKFSSLTDFLAISQIVSTAWNTGQMSKQQTDKLSLLFNKQLNRLMAGMYIEEYRVQYQVTIPTNSIKTISQIINILLDKCVEHEDAFVSRNLLGLLFTFNTVEEPNTKKLLHLCYGIGQNKLWKKTGFWDASIFESTYQEISVFCIQNGQSHSQTVLREKNMIFSQLAAYCHFMIMLGISSKNVRLTVGRYCRLYDMSEDQNKDLSKMITDTNKQFKTANVNSSIQ